MARELLSFFNTTIDGQGIEGLVNYSNRLTDYWMAPAFLVVLYALALYIMSSKTEWKFGGSLAWVSFGFFVISWVMQTITQFNQIIVFFFFVAMIAGVVISYIENAR